MIRLAALVLLAAAPAAAFEDRLGACLDAVLADGKATGVTLERFPPDDVSRGRERVLCSTEASGRDVPRRMAAFLESREALLGRAHDLGVRWPAYPFNSAFCPSTGDRLGVTAYRSGFGRPYEIEVYANFTQDWPC